MIFKNEDVFALVKSLNSKDIGCKNQDAIHWFDAQVIFLTTEERPIFIAVIRNFIKTLTKVDPFQSPTFYTSTNTLFEQLKAAFVAHSSSFIDAFQLQIVAHL